MVGSLSSRTDFVGLMLNYDIFHDARNSLIQKPKLQPCGLRKVINFTKHGIECDETYANFLYSCISIPT